MADDNLAADEVCHDRLHLVERPRIYIPRKKKKASVSANVVFNAKKCITDLGARGPRAGCR